MHLINYQILILILVFINSNSKFSESYNHFISCIPILNQKTHILVNDVNPNNDIGIINYVTMVEFLSRKKLGLIKYSHNCALLTIFNNKSVNFKKIESEFPLYMLTKIVDEIIKDINQLEFFKKELEYQKNRSFKTEYEKKSILLTKNFDKLDTLLEKYLSLGFKIDINIDHKLVKKLEYNIDYIDKFDLIDP